MLNERNQTQKSHTVFFNLYEVLELAKLIQGDRNGNSGCLRWEVGFIGKGTFCGAGNILF